MYKQCYGRAVIGAYNPIPKTHSKSPTKNRALRVPHLPKKVREDIRLTPGQIEEQKARLPIMPDLHGAPEHIGIQKPDLAKEKYLQSNHSTPDISIIQTLAQQEEKQSQGRSQLLSRKNSEPKLKVGPYQTLQPVEAPPAQAKPIKDILAQVAQAAKANKENIDRTKTQKKEIQEEPKETKFEKVSIEQANPLSQAINQMQVTQSPPFCVEHGAQDVTEFLHLLDPKNYRFLPHQFTQMIKPAGKKSHKSDQIGQLLTWNDPTDSQ